MIFGSEKFESLVGELQVASQMRAAASESHRAFDLENHPRVQAFRQLKREVRCALNLVAKLQPYVDAPAETRESFFRESLRAEATELAATPFGGTLLSTIGLSYHEFARKELDALEGISIGLRQAGRGVAARLNIAAAGINAAMSANGIRAIQKRAKKVSSGKDEPEGDQNEENIQLSPEEEEKFKKYMERISTSMLSAMWGITEIDLRTTLRHVCRKATHDHSVDENVRRLRLEGLSILGEVFLESGGTVAAGLGDVIERLTNNNTARRPETAETGSDKKSAPDGSS
jgi:hypothetical protein